MSITIKYNVYCINENTNFEVSKVLTKDNIDSFQLNDQENNKCPCNAVHQTDKSKFRIVKYEYPKLTGIFSIGEVPNKINEIIDVLNVFFAFMRK